MSDLDKKLEQILGLYRRDIERNYGGRTVGKTLTGDEAVVQIKQAFIDAGWRDVMHLEDRAKQGQFVTNKRVELLSGKEWYDRFEKEMDAISAYAMFDNHDDVDRALGAAKKAAGLGKD